MFKGSVNNDQNYTARWSWNSKSTTLSQRQRKRCTSESQKWQKSTTKAKGKIVDMQLLSESLPRFPTGEYVLVCMWNEACNHWEVQEEFGQNEDQFCRLPSSTVFIKLKTKTRTGDTSMWAIRSNKKTKSSLREWSTRDAKWKPGQRYKASSVWGAPFAPWRARSHFFWLINSQRSAKTSGVWANTIPIWWQVRQRLQEHIHFCQWVGAAPEVDGRIQITRARKGYTLTHSTIWKMSVSGFCLFSESHAHSSSSDPVHQNMFQLQQTQTWCITGTALGHGASWTFHPEDRISRLGPLLWC